MSILDHAKEISELIQKYNDQELYQKIIDLRDEIFSLREENLELKQKLHAIEISRDISAQLVRRDNFYYRENEKGEESGPFCMSCWDAEKKLVNVQLFSYGQYRCGACAVQTAKKT